MKYVSYIILFLTACNVIEREDLQGCWIVNLDDDKEIFFGDICFDKDTIRLIDEYLFKRKGRYRLNGDTLEASFGGETLIKTQLQTLTDSIIRIFDGVKYQRSESLLHSNIEEYNLIGINTDELLNEKKIFQVIHLYRSGGKTRIRCGDIIVGYDEVIFFFFFLHSNPEVLLFIGEGISLKELKEIYYQLLLDNQRKVTLVLNSQGIRNYQVFVDKIEIWRSDLEEHLYKTKNPFPPPDDSENYSKEEYLKGGGLCLEVKTKDDLEKMKEIVEGRKYVISISDGIDFRDYINLKKKLREIGKSKQVNYRTELI